MLNGKSNLTIKKNYLFSNAIFAFNVFILNFCVFVGRNISQGILT